MITPLQRLILRLLLRGWPVAKIAGYLGKSETAIKKAAYRGRRKLGL